MTARPYDNWTPPWKREFEASQANPAAECIKCLVPGLNHPFHDNGTVNSEADMAEFAPIDWYHDDEGNVKG